MEAKTFIELYEELSKLYESEELTEKDGFKKAAIAAGLLAGGIGAGAGIAHIANNIKDTPISAPAQVNNDEDDYLSYDDEQVDRLITLKGYVQVGNTLHDGSRDRIKMKVTNDKVILSSTGYITTASNDHKKLKDFDGIVLPGSGYICRKFKSKSISDDGKTFVLNGPSKEFFRELKAVPDITKDDLRIYCDGTAFASQIATVAYNSADTIKDDWADNLNVTLELGNIKVHYQEDQVTSSSYPKEVRTNNETTFYANGGQGPINITKDKTVISSATFSKLHHFNVGGRQDLETKEINYKYINIEEQRLVKIKLSRGQDGVADNYEFSWGKLDGNKLTLTNHDSFIKWVDDITNKVKTSCLSLELWFEL